MEKTKKKNQEKNEKKSQKFSVQVIPHRVGIDFLFTTC
jgi:hypothetical protein